MRLPLAVCSAILAMLIATIAVTEAGSLRNGDPGDLPAAGWSPSPHAEDLVPRSPLIVPGTAHRLDQWREVTAFTALAGVSLWELPEPPAAPLYTPTDVVTAATAPVTTTVTACPVVIVDAFTPLGPSRVYEGCVISFCESGWNVHAVGDSGASLGLFQIQPQHHQAKADALFGPGASLFDATVNAHTAVAIFYSWGGWGAWTERAALARGGVCTHGAVYPG